MDFKQIRPTRSGPSAKDRPGRLGLIPCREPAAQLDLALIEQASEPQRSGLLYTGETVLLMGEPRELTGGDDPAGKGFEKELTDRHGISNGM